MEQTQTETQSIQTYVTYDKYDNSKLTCTPSEQKVIPGTGPQAVPPSAPQYYYQIPLLYNYGSGDKKILDDFLLEGCEMETKVGIQSKPGQSGRIDHSIMVKFNTNDDSQNKFIKTMNDIHGGSAFILNSMKGVVKMFNFNKDMAEATGFKNPIYRPRDELTGEVNLGRAPSMFMKLFSRGKPPMVEQTLFTDLDGKPISWSLLEGVELKFIPLIHIKRVYIGGGKASLQMEVVSAIVTSIKARNTSSRQMETIHRLQQSRPDLVENVAAQLAKLTTDRQEQLIGGDTHNQQTAQVNTSQGNSSQPTFSGITPSNGSTQSNLSTPPQQHLPPVPQLGGSMQDFTSVAPVRMPPGLSTPVPSSPSNVSMQFN